MELPNLGKQCEESTCKQLDFLPYTCKCKKIFCLEHFQQHSLSCSVINETREILPTDHRTYKCSHPNCTDISIVPLICDKCKQHFCVVHRHINECYKEDPKVKAAAIAKQQIPINKFNEAKAEVDKKIDASLNTILKKKKNIEMACKVQLMRIKNKATGSKSIPTDDRIYFNIQLPNKSTKPLFISKSWTVGRAIDAIASECNVKNENNQSNALKLRLFKVETGNLLSTNMSAQLAQLLADNILINGESLILEYVNDECTHLEV